MKALTLAPDWAMLVLTGEKTVEYRTWRTSYRGDILICSSAKKIRDCISGHGLMVARLVDCVPFTEEHLHTAAMDWMPEDPGYAWLFDDFRMIYPFPVKGRLGLFEVDTSNLKYIDFGDPENNPADDATVKVETEALFNEVYAPLFYYPARSLALHSKSDGRGEGYKIAHIRNFDGGAEEQTIEEQCRNTAALASEFGESSGMKNLALVAGPLHDRKTVPPRTGGPETRGKMGEHSHK